MPLTLKNFYKQGWQPDPSRTIFYYDFEDSSNRLKDTSGNNNDAISVSNITYGTVGDQTVAQTTGNSCGITIPQNLYGNIGTGDFALSFWTYCINPSNSNCSPMLFGLSIVSSPYTGINIFYNPRNAYSQGDAVLWRLISSNQKAGTRQASTMNNAWHHFVMTRSSGTVTCYIDGEQDAQFTDNTSLPSSCGQSWMLSRPNLQDQSFSAGAMGDKYILENIAWSADDVTNYYNQTKGIYGIQVLNNNLNNNLSNTLTPTVIPDTPNSGSGDVLTIGLSQRNG